MSRVDPAKRCHAATTNKHYGYRCANTGKHELTFHYGMGRAEEVRLCGIHIKGLTSGILRLATGDHLARAGER